MLCSRNITKQTKPTPLYSLFVTDADLQPTNQPIDRSVLFTVPFCLLVPSMPSSLRDS